jgi:uncharacterized protein
LQERSATRCARVAEMALAPELKELLACPKCKGELEFREQEARILCKTCKLAYRIEEDIPVMLIDEATALPE